MKDYARILESNRKAAIQSIVHLNGDTGNHVQWNALKLIEDTAERLRTRLAAVLPEELREKVTSVKLDLHQPPDKSLPLFVKGRFYGLNKKELLLKVFVHQENGRGKSLKIARAVYRLELQRKVEAA